MWESTTTEPSRLRGKATSPQCTKIEASDRGRRHPHPFCTFVFPGCCALEPNRGRGDGLVTAIAMGSAGTTAAAIATAAAAAPSPAGGGDSRGGDAASGRTFLLAAGTSKVVP